MIETNQPIDFRLSTEHRLTVIESKTEALATKAEVQEVTALVQKEISIFLRWVIGSIVVGYICLIGSNLWLSSRPPQPVSVVVTSQPQSPPCSNW